MAESIRRVESYSVEVPDEPGEAYRVLSWLEEAGVTATFQEVGLRVLGRRLAIGVWSPGEGGLPLLVAHDGPEYDEQYGRRGSTSIGSSGARRQAICRCKPRRSTASSST